MLKINASYGGTLVKKIFENYNLKSRAKEFSKTKSIQIGLFSFYLKKYFSYPLPINL